MPLSETVICAAVLPAQVSLQAGIITKGDCKHMFLSIAVNITYCVCLQVKGYRYLEEDNSDESDSDRSEEDEEKEEERVVEEMEAEDGEEGGQDRGAHGADSPGARRRGAEGQRHKRKVAHMKDEETDEHE